jgi:hypothetical protein
MKFKYPKWLMKLLYRAGWCPYCQQFHWPWTIKNRRLNTAYADDKANWMYSCLPAYQEQVEYYKERWDDYYHG